MDLRGTKASPYARSAAAAVAVFVFLACCLWPATAAYRRTLLGEVRARVASQTSQYANSVGASVHRRTGLLEGLVSFTQAAPSEQVIAATFPVFAAGLRNGAPGVRAVILAPDGVMRHVFPQLGNEGVRGHDILQDTRPWVQAEIDPERPSRRHPR